MSRKKKQMLQTLTELHAFAFGLPEAWADTPWGETVAKVRKKVFVFLGKEPGQADRIGFSVKLPESGDDLLATSIGEPTRYGLGASGWVTVGFDPGEEPPIEVLCEWIEESYRAVAPKKLIKELDSTAGQPDPRPAAKKRPAKKKKPAARKKPTPKKPSSSAKGKKKPVSKKTSSSARSAQRKKGPVAKKRNSSA